MDIDEDDVINTTEIYDAGPAGNPKTSALASEEESEVGSRTPTSTHDQQFNAEEIRESSKSNGVVSLPEILFSDVDGSDVSLQLEPDGHIAEGFKSATYPTISVEVPASRYHALPYSTSQSGLVYDPRMRFHTELKPIMNDDHPEDPSRISEIFQELIDGGLVQDPNNMKSPGLPLELQLARINCRQATTAEIALVHDTAHIEWVRSLASWAPEDLVAEGAQLDSVYLHNQTYLCASLSAGGAIEATKAVVSGQVKNAIAVIRPPGHHAEHSKPGGFCFFNNVCIATKVCQADFPDICRKVLILDWDVHHGNGVQEAFYSDPNVLYISIHVYQGGRFYPHGPRGNHVHCGEGVGIGKNVNIPWAHCGRTDADYIYAFQQVVMPIGIEFDPDLVIISAGFDAAEGDELGQCHVSPAGYAHMTHMLMQLANGKVVACLEGGYNLRSIAKSTLAVTRTLMGEPPDRLAEDFEPTSSAVNDVQMVIRQQAKFWQHLYPKDMGTLMPQIPSERLHDVIRAWQSEVLWKQYHMSELFVLRQSISKSFEKQVLATPNFNSNRPLLVIFHDPPEALGLPDPRTSKLELHNTWIADASKTYIDWAIAHDFSVIDVNIPKFVTDVQTEKEFGPSEPGQVRYAMAVDLSIYLWENYIEINDASHVFFLGIGDACAGLTELLKNTDDTLDRVDCFISILGSDNLLRRVVREDDDTAAIRYFRNSLVFISTDHAIWTNPKRIRKSHGTLVRSPHTDLADLLVAHKPAITARLAAATAIPGRPRARTHSPSRSRSRSRSRSHSAGAPPAPPPPVALPAAPGPLPHLQPGPGPEPELVPDPDAMQTDPVAPVAAAAGLDSRMGGAGYGEGDGVGREGGGV